MSFNPVRELFVYFCIRRVPGQLAYNVAFFLGKQINTPADLIDIEFNDPCHAPRRVLRQDLLAFVVAFVAPVHVPGQEKANQYQRKDNQNRSVVLHAIIATASGEEKS